MTPTRGPDWKRLARYVRARRNELELTQTEFAVQSGVSKSTLDKIEGASQDGYRRDTYRALDVGLRWQPGSAKAVLAGGEPVEAEEHADGDDVDRRVLRLLGGLEQVSGTVANLAARTGELDDRVRALELRVDRLDPPAAPKPRR